ncbi:LL-diaminopimelate aminotransferase [compost metagenome]
MRGDGQLEVAPLYERRRDLFIDALAKEGWVVPSPAATMFIWTPLPGGYAFTELKGRSRQFAHELVLKTGVVVIPGDAFGAQGEGFVRIALVEDEARLLEAARRIGEYLQTIRTGL